MTGPRWTVDESAERGALHNHVEMVAIDKNDLPLVTVIAWDALVECVRTLAKARELAARARDDYVTIAENGAAINDLLELLTEVDR